MLREPSKWQRFAQGPEYRCDCTGADWSVVVTKVLRNGRGDEGTQIVQLDELNQLSRVEQVVHDKLKSRMRRPKRNRWDAYKKVKANR